MRGRMPHAWAWAWADAGCVGGCGGPPNSQEMTHAYLWALTEVLSFLPLAICVGTSDLCYGVRRFPGRGGTHEAGLMRWDS